MHEEITINKQAPKLSPELEEWNVQPCKCSWSSFTILLVGNWILVCTWWETSFNSILYMFPFLAEARDGALRVGGDPPPWVSFFHQDWSSGGQHSILWRPECRKQFTAAWETCWGAVAFSVRSPLQSQLQEYFHVHGRKLWLHHCGWVGYSSMLLLWILHL